MADSHLFGDYFAEPETSKTEKPESHLFGSHFVEESPKGSPSQRISESFSAVAEQPTNTLPRAPISGFTKEQSDELNARPETRGGENPRRYSDPQKLPRDLAASSSELPSDIGGSIASDFSGSKKMFESGIGDLAKGDILPTLMTSPKDWKAGGVLKTILGPVGMVGSPISGTLKETVDNPLTKITGNPSFGERASILTPVGGIPAAVGKAAKVATGSKAVNALVDLVGAENVPSVIERLKSNPNLRLADASPEVRNTVRGFIDPAQPNAMRAVSESAERSRAGNAKGARDAYEATLGPRPEALTVLDNIKKKAQDVGTSLINPAIKGSKPVDLAPVISEIDSVLKPGARGVVSPDIRMELSPLQKELVDLRQKLTDGKSTFFDAQKIHEVQSELRRRAEDLSSSAVGSERALGRQLYDVREKIVGAVDRASGGQYRPALSAYKDANDVERAFEKGLGVATNRPGIKGIVEDSPAALERWKGAASAEELKAHELGVLENYHRKIDSMKNAARAGSEIPDIEFNRKKMEITFGKEKSDDLLKKMKDIKDIAETNSKWLHGSDTAKTQAAQRAFAIPEVGRLQHHLPYWPVLGGVLGHESGIPFLGTALGAAATSVGGAKVAAQKLQQISALSRNAEMARLSGATGLDRADLIMELASHPKVISYLKKGGGGGIPSATP